MIVIPNQVNIFQVVGDFITNVISTAGFEVVQGQVNRTPEPANADFAVMWPILRNRIETNTDAAIDTLFTATIAGTVMTVSAVAFGTIEVTNEVFGNNVTAGTTIVPGGTGTGGVGTYNLSASSTVASPEQMACGTITVTQPTEVVIQLDVHGPNASDNAQIISTMWRDDYGYNFINGENNAMAPLFTSDPRMAPFSDAEQQIEIRYILELHLQVNQAVIIPQQFAGVVEVDVISVEEAYQ